MLYWKKIYTYIRYKMTTDSNSNSHHLTNTKKKISTCKIFNEEFFLYDVVDFNKSILESFYIKDSLLGIPIYVI